MSLRHLMLLTGVQNTAASDTAIARTRVRCTSVTNFGLEPVSGLMTTHARLHHRRRTVKGSRCGGGFASGPRLDLASAWQPSSIRPICHRQMPGERTSARWRDRAHGGDFG
jgi:hypothetical protein